MEAPGPPDSPVGRQFFFVPTFENPPGAIPWVCAVTAKRVAEQGNSAPRDGPKQVARQGNSATPRVKRATAGTQRGAGARLRAELARDTDQYGVTVLINQAARIADRLDKLDRVITGADVDWLRLDMGRVQIESGEARRRSLAVAVTMKIDGAVVEERQQSMLLTKLLAEIYRQRAGIQMKPPEDELDDLDDLDD